MGYLKTTLKITAFVFAFAFLVIGCNHTGTGRVGGFVMCAVCAVVGLLFCIPTKADAERKRIRNERREANAARIEAERSRIADQPAPIDGARNGDPLKRFLIGATVLQVLAFPFLVIADLLKMQK